MSIDDFKKLKVQEVQWLMNRINKELEKVSKEGGVSNAPHHNTNDIRSLQGKSLKAPSKGKSFNGI